MSREYGYGEGQAQEPMVWERVEWRQGDGRYVFEVARGGLLATLSSPHGAKLTLPMVAWEGLLDALAAARKTKVRSERNMPSRTGARWSDSEAQELAKAFKAGGSIAQLARVHNRTPIRPRGPARAAGPVGSRGAKANGARRGRASVARNNIRLRHGNSWLSLQRCNPALRAGAWR